MIHASSRLFLLTLVAVLFCSTSAFVIVAPTATPQKSTALNLFGGLKGAFSNDDSLGKAENAGIKGGPKFNDKVTFNGKALKNVVPGQAISKVAASNRVKITYSCKKGDCGTCEILVNGRMTKACQATIPNGKCDMRTL